MVRGKGDTNQLSRRPSIIVQVEDDQNQTYLLVGFFYIFRQFGNIEQYTSGQ